MDRLQQRNHTCLTRITALLLVAVCTAACSPTISLFNERAYEQAVTLKVRSLELVAATNEPFEAHAEAVLALRRDLAIAREFAAGLPSNEITTAQWDLLLDPDGHLLIGFLDRWEEQGAQSDVFVREMSRLIAEAFDTIIGLESGKLKPSDL
ncbi:MAG: hypothetical protein ACNA78_02435 [Balneolaceae bacterium]